MKAQSAAVKNDLQTRLRRIEGQARGVQKMLDDERDCREIIQQLNAIRAAVQNATSTFMRAYARDCLLQMDGVEESEYETLVDDLINLMARVN